MKKIFPTCVLFLFVSLKSFAFGVTAVSVAESCPNAHNGMIVVTAGGVAPYTYTLNPGNIISTSNTFSGLAAGSYNIFVVDALGNTGSTTVLVFLAGSPNSSSSSITVCSNQLPYHFNGTDIYVPGTYSDTLTNMTGCDSIITLNLSMTPVSSSVANITICPSQTPYTWNGQQYNSTGVYSITFPGSSGCDSIATLNLNVTTVDEWIGAVSNVWEDPLNWSCGVPISTSDVIINSGIVVLNSNTTINSLDLNSAATLTVNAGFQLSVLH